LRQSIARDSFRLRIIKEIIFYFYILSKLM
jgi:hypothetical protein